MPEPIANIDPSTQAAAAYNAIPYTTSANPASHPDRLAVVSRLMGLPTAPIEGCRVLELGCGDGLNLIPLAVALPGATFVGVDIAPDPIVRGLEIIADLGLDNVSLQVGDVTRLDPGLGEFDYIIAHGLYSWVPAAVRDGLLRACREHLSERGVAYVSYNALPGGHLRRMLREMMLFHVRDLTDPEERAAEAKALAGFVARAWGDTPGDDPYRAILLHNARLAARRPEADLFHDDLAEVYEPVYVGAFIGHAAQHGLQFVAEANFFEMSPGRMSDEALAALAELESHDIALKEQYLDFLKARQFRQTIICRKEIALDRSFKPGTIAELLTSADLEWRGEVAEGRRLFQGDASEAVLMVFEEWQEAVLVALKAEWPEALPFGRLLGVAGAAAPALSRFKVTRQLAEFLQAAYASGGTRMYTRPPRVVREPDRMPVASPLARWQVAHAIDPLTTLRHESLAVDRALARSVVTLADGTRDGEALAREAAGTEDEVATVLTELGLAGLLVR